jgi:hypothetical protein
VKSGREVVPCVHRGHDSVPRARGLGPRGRGRLAACRVHPSKFAATRTGERLARPLILYTQRVAHRRPA